MRVFEAAAPQTFASQTVLSSAPSTCSRGQLEPGAVQVFLYEKHRLRTGRRARSGPLLEEMPVPVSSASAPRAFSIRLKVLTTELPCGCPAVVVVLRARRRNRCITPVRSTVAPYRRRCLASPSSFSYTHGDAAGFRFLLGP